MRIGKTQGLVCDNCQGHFVEGETLVTPEVELHWCSQGCRMEYMLEEFNDYIQEEISERVEEEIKYLHGLVCPACKYRLVRAQ